MSFSQIIALSSWLAPIPFMILYSLKTKRLNSLFIPTMISLLSLPILTSLRMVYFHPDVGFSLAISLIIGLYFLRKKYDYPQAFSFAFIITFLNSLYWELPIIVYTVFYRGYIDQAMPLHILSAFPMFFIYQKIKIVNWKKTALLLTSGLIVSIVFMLPLIQIGIIPAFLSAKDYAPPSWVQALWVANRLICFIPLFYIVYNSGLINREIDRSITTDSINKIINRDD